MMETKEERKRCVLVWDTACDDVIHYMCAALHYLVPRLICNSLLSVRLRPSAIITSLQRGLSLQQMDFPIITITILVSVIPLFFHASEGSIFLRRRTLKPSPSQMRWPRTLEQNHLKYEKNIYFCYFFCTRVEGRRVHTFLSFTFSMVDFFLSN